MQGMLQLLQVLPKRPHLELHQARPILLQVPKLESDYGEDAARFLSQATGSGKRLTARIERKERQQPQQGRGGRDPLASQSLLHVILFKEGSDAVGESVNADILRAGLARLKVPRNAKVSVPLSVCACLYVSVVWSAVWSGCCKPDDTTHVEVRLLCSLVLAPSALETSLRCMRMATRNA